jgi:ABC-type nitrate/sulfonate/bicarbonate transport system ATPase subunit
MVREKVGEGVEAAKRFERHVEEIATKLVTKETMTHFANAGLEMIQAANVAFKNMDVPKEAKQRLHKAQREALLAWRSAIDVVLAELDKEVPAKSAGVTKIKIRQVKPAKRKSK